MVNILNTFKTLMARPYNMTCSMLLFATELILMRLFENFRYFSFWFQYHKSCKSILQVFNVYYMQQRDAESFDHFKSTVFC